MGLPQIPNPQKLGLKHFLTKPNQQPVMPQIPNPQKLGLKP